MRGARRRPYVDRVKPGNEVDARPGRNPEGDGALSNGFAVARPFRQGYAPRSRSDRSGAHLVVGRPCNIDILRRAILLNLHPTSPPSHTCLYMK